MSERQICIYGGRDMKRFSLIGAVCGVLSGVGMIYASIVDGNIPKTVWILISIGWFIAVASQICNYRYFNKKDL